jgi:hypothetical protein
MLLPHPQMIGANLASQTGEPQPQILQDTTLLTMTTLYPQPPPTKPRARDKRKFFWTKERSAKNEGDDRDLDYSNSTIALTLPSDRGSQVFSTFKDRQNKDSIPPMVIEFILKHRNICAVFYFIRLQITWYAMVNYLTHEWQVAVCRALEATSKIPITNGVPYLMTLSYAELIRAIALVIMPTSPQEFMHQSCLNQSPARFVSHDSVYNYNIAELQRGLKEYSILCVGNIHWTSIRLDFSRDKDL